MPARTLTMTAIVGANVRQAREDLGWSQQELVDRLAEIGVNWSRPTVAQLELGKRGTTVDDLVAVALALGVAPHVLLYPPPSVDVDVAGEALPGPDLAHWLFQPDQSPYSEVERSERSVWFASARVAEGMTDEDANRLAEQIQQDALSKDTGRRFLRSGITVTESASDHEVVRTGADVQIKPKTRRK